MALILGISFEQAGDYTPTLGEIPPIIMGGERVKCSPGSLKVARAEFRGARQKPRNWKYWRKRQRGGG